MLRISSNMKYRFFDLDGTVTESRQKISIEMKNFLENSKVPFAIISGASKEQMEYQLDGLRCDLLAQSGNDTPIWYNKLTNIEKKEIRSHIKELGDIIRIYSDKVEDRGCQISFSFTGHSAPIDIKKNFDPDRKIRKQVLRLIPFKSKTLAVKIAGTTCFDYTRKDGTKGDNIKRWIKEKNLKKNDCIYYGDALFKGGNDESVIGVIKTVSIINPQDLLTKLND